MDPRPQLGKIITAAIDDDAKRLILGGERPGPARAIRRKKPACHRGKRAL